MQKKIMVFTMLCAFLTGCRIHEYCEYKSVNLNRCGGELGIYVRSKQENYQKGRKKYARHGFPYELVIVFSAPVRSDSNYEYWKTFSLGSLTATGVETGKILTLDDEIDEFSKIGTTGFRFPITRDMGVIYEPFDIEAEITIIHSDGTRKSERIKVRLEKDYKKKRQSDTLDFMESV